MVKKFVPSKNEVIAYVNEALNEIDKVVRNDTFAINDALNYAVGKNLKIAKNKTEEYYEKLVAGVKKILK